MKYKPKATTQPMTQQKDEVQQKPRNFLYSDVLKNNKVVPI